MTTATVPTGRRLPTALRAFASADVVFKASVIVLALMVIITVTATLTGFAGSSSDTVGRRMSPPGPGWPLGTDSLGRSLLPRLLEGIGTTLLLSALAVCCTAVLGTLLGILAAYFGGPLNESVMRIIDVLYSFPALILAIMVASLSGPGKTAALASIVLVTCPLMTRMVRVAALGVVDRDYVIAAKISGVPTWRILQRHVLSGVSGAIAVQGSYALSIGILVEGGLSYLGYGVTLPDASLGLLIQEGALYFSKAPWLLLAPGVVIVIAILAINLIGDSLRDRFEPRETRSLV